MSNLNEELIELDNQKHAEIMQDKQIVNELADYNLLLLRKIYDAYEERADKVLKNFRSDNNNVLRQRYMVPIVNPNYPYDKLLQDIKEAGLLKEKDLDEQFLDGETVVEDGEQQVIEAI